MQLHEDICGSQFMKKHIIVVQNDWELASRLNGVHEANAIFAAPCSAAFSAGKIL